MGLAQPSEGMDEMGDVRLVQLTSCFLKGRMGILQSKNLMFFLAKKKSIESKTFISMGESVEFDNFSV